jgi:type I restriction enzyme M protein
MFWSSGTSNPVTAIEQITYLLFLKRLESKDDEWVKQGRRSIYAPRDNCNLPHHPHDGTPPPGVKELPPKGKCVGHWTCRWSYINPNNPSPELLSEYVFPWLRDLEETMRQVSNEAQSPDAVGDRMKDAYFQLNPGKSAMLRNAIQAVDALFGKVSVTSANADIMGDIFEHLLEKIHTSGTNGQFRTPRHIIRFMIDLVDLQTHEPMIDPAAGTCGFPTNAVLHLMKEHTDPETLRLEWDGTPHRADGLSKGADVKPYLAADHFVGYDIDRTMVRIGWMNTILHGIDNPKVELHDTLGKSFTEEGRYKVALANPPYTGKVDAPDLNDWLRAFDTEKSELLFIWQILRLLQTGGRAAVIVPEGLLFGGTGAHRALRRQMLLHNQVRAVVSLPAGVFQPYTGVKTSILYFQREQPDLLQPDRAAQPRTSHVWFYEVGEDGFSLNAKRDPRFTADNDLWDALVKWRAYDAALRAKAPPEQLDTLAASRDYYQPRVEKQRWRVVDKVALAIFPELDQLTPDQPWSLKERFPELPDDPGQATDQIAARQTERMAALYRAFYTSKWSAAQAAAANSRKKGADHAAAMREALKKEAGVLAKAFNAGVKAVLEDDDGFNSAFGRKAFKQARDAVQPALDEWIDARIAREADAPLLALDAHRDWETEARDIAREFAKLDGYDIYLRSVASERRESALAEAKSWRAPVRAWLRRDEWAPQPGENGAVPDVRGNLDEHGEPRPEFLREALDGAGAVRPEYVEDYLDPDCIEANDYGLNAGRYKPFTLEAATHEPGALARLIRELDGLHATAQDDLKTLLKMVEGRA